MVLYGYDTRPQVGQRLVHLDPHVPLPFRHHLPDRIRLLRKALAPCLPQNMPAALLALHGAAALPEMSERKGTAVDR